MAADFSGGRLSSDGGVLLLRQLDSSLGLTRSVANCFQDRRNPIFIDHIESRSGILLLISPWRN